MIKSLANPCMYLILGTHSILEVNKGSNPEVRKDLIDERVWRKVIAFGQRQAATEETAKKIPCFQSKM